MWIERMELAGFGNVIGEKIEFENDKLNLLVEANEYGKSTMASAVWAALFDFPQEFTAQAGPDKVNERDAMRPRGTASHSFQVTIYVSANDRLLKIVRDFDKKSVRVFDRSQSDRDVTDEFLGPHGEDEVGLRLTGMTRDLFRSTCFVGQRELDEHTIGGAKDLAAVFQGIADSSSTGHTAGDAIAALTEALNLFSYKGAKLGAEQAVHSLEVEWRELHDKLKSLKAEREAIAQGLTRLAEIDAILAASPEPQGDENVQELVNQKNDLDSKILRTRHASARITDIDSELVGLDETSEKVAEWEVAVRDLWQKWEARRAEYDNLTQEGDKSPNQADEMERSFQRKWRGLAEFTIQDAQSLSLLVIRASELTKELNDLKAKRDAEAQRLAQGAVDVSKHETARQQLSALDQRDTSDALSYFALINSAKEQITECERNVVKHRASLTEIDHQRVARRGKDRIFAIAGAAGFLVLAGAAFLLKGVLVAAVLLGLMALAAAGAAGFFGRRFMKPSEYRKKDYEKAEQELEKTTTLAQNLHSKIGALQGKLESVARKAGLANGAQLIALLHERTEAAPQMKGIDTLNSEIATKEAHHKRAMEELEMYFQKAGIPARELSIERAQKLSEDVAVCVEEGRSLQTATTQSRLKLQQIGFMRSELDSIEGKLKEIFASVGIANPEALDEAYARFNTALEAYYQAQKLKGERGRLEQDCLAGSGFSDLDSYIDHMELRRNELRDQIEKMSGGGTSGAAGGGGLNRAERDKLSDERNNIILKVRVAAKSVDDNYLPTLDMIEQVEKELSSATRAKQALELARETLAKLSGETYVDWSAKLNLIADEMLRDLNLDYDSLRFSKDLHLEARRRGDAETITSPYFSNLLSVGTREQLHWLARMVVSRYLSHDNPLPIILDEPFSESDDDRFLRIMEFVVDTLTRQHQVIIFSCHRQRHQWLYEQLTADKKQRVLFCKRGAIGTASGAGVPS
ncbi:MAG TPA: AAA family ATPase [Candidatus Obscuribacterales bacterium]